jgi:SagB-type dehydrogenase family enzyme
MRTGINPKPRNNDSKIHHYTYPIDTILTLSNASNNIYTNFFEVLSSRTSERTFKKMSEQDLSNLLWHSAKIKRIHVKPNSEILIHRASPSAGGNHPIDILISPSQTLKKRKLYYYNALTHKLGNLKIDKSTLYNFFLEIDSCLASKNATIVWFSAMPNIISSKYQNFKSLLWRDAGSLLQTVHLTACALKLKSCAIGTLGEPHFSRLFGAKHNLISAGGLLVGK